ncbi:hypothetical protein ABZ628_29190 [Streptomyces diastaticus]|uniref:hypothetical protein n=1 Tax=Streptomyces diastaticus TaxID=1956 RepID=UPI0033F871BF
MARISVKVIPLHPDRTECTHAVVCSACGPVGEPHGLRVLAEPAQSKHRHNHKASPTPATR